MKTKWLSVALPIVLLVSGCSRTVYEDEQVLRTENADHAAPTPSWFSQSYRLLLTEVRYPPPVGTSGGPGNNCVLFESQADVQILNGTALVRWTPNSPATEELTLGISTGHKDLIEVRGKSPLNVTLRELETAHATPTRDPRYYFQVHAQRPGASIRQDFDLELSFDYVTPSPVRAYALSCS